MESNHKPFVCPVCGKITYGEPAISRTDNVTWICSDCGTDEAIKEWINHRHDDDEQSSQ